jgi:predicted nucleic acid-binding protein
MDIVIDASAILAVLLNEPERARIIEATRGTDLMAPESLPFEIGNALSALLRRKLLGTIDGLAVWHGFSAMPIRFVEVDIPTSLMVAGEEGIYAYDAYILTCAAGYRSPLLTLDKRLTAVARSRGTALLEV